jgi:hypothetical protein
MEEVVKKRIEVAEWGCPQPLELEWFDKVPHKRMFMCGGKIYKFSRKSIKFSMGYYNKNPRFHGNRETLIKTKKKVEKWQRMARK